MTRLLRAMRYYEIVRRRSDTGSRALEEAFGVLSARYFHGFWERAAGALDAVVEEVGDAFLRIRKNDRWTFVQRHLVMLDNWLSRSIVDNKSLVYAIGADYGWRAPRYLDFDYLDIGRAERFMRESGAPVVVKPRASSRGNGITTRIAAASDLRKATAWASSFGRALMVEEFVEGDNFRLLFLDGEMVAALRREPPHVTGDGIHSVREFMRRENARRLHDPVATSLIPLTLDFECRHMLRLQGLTEHSIPGEGVRVRLKSVINQNAARENHTWRGPVHPSITELGRRVGAVLNLKLFGMDLITKDIAAPLAESGGVINEINTQPGLHYHDLVAEDADKVPVGELVLDAIFTRTDRRWSS